MEGTKVSILTPTGDRPLQLSLCRHYVSRFTSPDDSLKWLVADDGVDGDSFREDTSGTFGFFMRQPDVLRRPPRLPGKNTIARNLGELAPYAIGDVIVIVEDDDWYAPEWIERCVQGLEDADLFGEQQSVYYNVRERRWQQMYNFRHGSLFQTAFRAHVLPLFMDVLAESQRLDDPFIDMKFWERAGSSSWRYRRNLVLPSFRSIGIKGISGRPGAGNGHNMELEHRDPQLHKLREWLGVVDAERYERFYG